MNQTTAESTTFTPLLDRISEVCPIPATAQRVIGLTSTPTTNAQEIVDALASDPAMAAEVLRVANSAIYARSRRVMDLRQATTVIGLSELRGIAAAMGLLAAFRSDAELSLHLHGHGALSGAICRSVVAALYSSMTGAGLISGLLCEVGALACLSVDAEGYVALWKEIATVGPVWSAAGCEARDALEIARYGGTTREIGARLLRRNQLPEEIALAVEAPHRSGRTPTPLGAVTAFARRSAPMLVSLLGSQSRDANAIGIGLSTLALETQIGRIDVAELERICVEAAVQTELSLRKTRHEA